MKRSGNGTFHHVSHEDLDRSGLGVLRSGATGGRRGSIGLRAAVLGIPPEVRHAQPNRAITPARALLPVAPTAGYLGRVSPTRDLDERVDIEGEPDAVLRALLAVARREPVASPPPPETGDEAIRRMLDPP